MNEPEYTCLSEAGWVLVERIEDLISQGLNDDQVAAALGIPTQDLIHLVMIANKNRTDLIDGITPDAD